MPNWRQRWAWIVLRLRESCAESALGTKTDSINSGNLSGRLARYEKTLYCFLLRWSSWKRCQTGRRQGNWCFTELAGKICCGFKAELGCYGFKLQCSNQVASGLDQTIYKWGSDKAWELVPRTFYWADSTLSAWFTQYLEPGSQWKTEKDGV